LKKAILRKAGFSTRAIHAGQEPDSRTGAVTPPLYQTSTFQQTDFAEYKYDYSRANNPTRSNLETNLASLEEGEYAVCFGSGLAAESAVLSLLESGDHIIFSDNVYGGTYRLMEKVHSRFGLKADWVDTSDLNKIEAAITPRTRMLFIESPTNPMMQLSDIQAVSGIARKHNLLLVVDNTFLSPYFQRPLTLGADIVVHSTTKYLNGHSDVVGGVVVTNDPELNEKLRFLQMSVGGVPGPFDCWLTLRSVKTLAVRMEKHNSNAIKLAEFLEKSGKFEAVYYSGLKSHPQHALAVRQQQSPAGCPGFGGMISIGLKDLEAARSFTKALNLFTLAESLGGVESLICHPASMTHASIPYEKRQHLGITDGLLRLSAGIEEVGDLRKDLHSAMSHIKL